MRITRRCPGGEITVFNRSHHEDVLVPAVNGWITKEQHHQRFGHINDFERMLTHTGTIVLSSCCTSALRSNANCRNA